jgi:hypothetical protein
MPAATKAKNNKNQKQQPEETSDPIAVLREAIDNIEEEIKKKGGSVPVTYSEIISNIKTSLSLLNRNVMNEENFQFFRSALNFNVIKEIKKTEKENDNTSESLYKTIVKFSAIYNILKDAVKNRDIANKYLEKYKSDLAKNAILNTYQRDFNKAIKDQVSKLKRSKLKEYSEDYGKELLDEQKSITTKQMRYEQKIQDDKQKFNKHREEFNKNKKENEND